MKQIKKILLCVLFMPYVCAYALECPRGTVQAIVNNTSPNQLKLETVNDKCETFDVATVDPNINAKYCVKTEYMLKISTLSLGSQTPLAVTIVDLRDDVVVTTTKKMPDIEFIHGKTEVEPQEAETPPLPKALETKIDDIKQKVSDKVGADELPPLPKAIEKKMGIEKKNGDSSEEENPAEETKPLVEEKTTSTGEAKQDM